jgi:hypothetical protein
MDHFIDVGEEVVDVSGNVADVPGGIGRRFMAGGTFRSFGGPRRIAGGAGSAHAAGRSAARGENQQEENNEQNSRFSHPPILPPGIASFAASQTGRTNGRAHSAFSLYQFRVQFGGFWFSVLGVHARG